MLTLYFILLVGVLVGLAVTSVVAWLRKDVELGYLVCVACTCYVLIAFYTVSIFISDDSKWYLALTMRSFAEWGTRLLPFLVVVASHTVIAKRRKERCKIKQNVILYSAVDYNRKPESKPG